MVSSFRNLDPTRFLKLLLPSGSPRSSVRATCCMLARRAFPDLIPFALHSRPPPFPAAAPPLRASRSRETRYLARASREIPSPSWTARDSCSRDLHLISRERRVAGQVRSRALCVPAEHGGGGGFTKRDASAATPSLFSRQCAVLASVSQLLPWPRVFAVAFRWFHSDSHDESRNPFCPVALLALCACYMLHAGSATLPRPHSVCSPFPARNSEDAGELARR